MNSLSLNIKEFAESTLSKILEEKLINVLQVVENSAKENCPIDDGVLRASITHKSEMSESSIDGVVTSNVDYAPYVHEGTGIYATGGKGRKTPWVYKDPKYGFIRTNGQKPQPFLQDAIDENMGAIENYFKGAFD